jgi:hypothetical protein
MKPNPHDVILPGESADDLVALYNDILARHVVDPEMPSPLEVMEAWECAKLVWWTVRMGVSREAMLDQAYGRGHADRRRAEIVEMGHRGDVRKLALQQIKTIRSMTRALKGDLGSAFRPEGLRVVGGTDP